MSVLLLTCGFLVVSGGQASAAPSLDCSTPLVIAVHGMGEGPDENGSGNFSAALEDTVGRLQNLETENSRPIADVDFLRYPTIGFETLSDLDFWRHGDFRAAVRTASRGLSSEVSQSRAVCPERQVSLVGYSLGSWIVDDYLAGETTQHRQRWFSGVLLYGDPEWPTPSPGGLAREIGHVHITPYKPAGLGSRFLSMCLSHDPVCNASHDPATVRGPQLAACALGVSGCAHARYQLDGATERGADALFGWTR